MATTVGPDMPLSPRLVVSAHAAADDLESSDALKQRPPSSPRSNPPPNPPFVFPARPSPSSAPPSYSRASGRRPKSLADSFHLGDPVTAGSDRRKSLSPALPDFSFNPGRRSPIPDQTPASGRLPALPDFKFNPGAGFAPPPATADHPFLSPPQSPHMPQAPSSPRAIPTRPGGGHRRGGSEFVGGQIRSGDAITVLSTSPTKSESGFASPQLKPANPRRGHAHRRSAAISSHDLSMILKPTSPQPRGSSAPNSPAAFDPVDARPFPNPPEQGKEQNGSDGAKVAADNAATRETNSRKEAAGDDETNAPARPPNRARVGFSDTLEFIPRPLSLVSSDTSSTATARPGHSLSGSISSIISLTGSTTLERDAWAIIPSPRKSTDPRPSTAGAVLEQSQSQVLAESTRSPQRRNSIPLLNAAALDTAVGQDAPSPGKTPKRWSFFGLEPFTGTMSPTRTRPLSSSSSDTASKQATSSSDEREADSATDPDPVMDKVASTQRTVGKKGSKKKQKKVRTWAGSILTRKSKHRHSKKSSKGRVQTPPPANGDATDEDSDGTAEANTEVAVEAASGADPTSADADGAEWSPGLYSPPEDDAPYPMIDLDAALGPFNTPLPRNPEWEAAQRASGLSKRPLHSAARLSPNLNYQHRRAESAPEMPPFNRAGIPRFSSNSTMADVFEEDEEDESKPGDETPGASSVKPDGSTKDDAATSIDIRVTPETSGTIVEQAPEPSDDVTPSRAISRKGSGLSSVSDEDKTEPSVCPTSECSTSSLHDEMIMEESSDVAWRGRDARAPLGVDTSGSSTPSPRRAFKGKDLVPVDVSPLRLPTPSLAPISPYSIGQSSSFPSPRSPMSYEDGNRISTAPSSVTEDTFQSLLMGEPGPEVRLSMDMPSLTSSNSTMTRESAFVHQLSQPPVPGERPASFSSPFGRRGSLASIGRLISTSHGERSKLSMEVSLNTEEKKSGKTSKAKRLSRMMQFWKSKDSSSTT